MFADIANNTEEELEIEVDNQDVNEKIRMYMKQMKILMKTFDLNTILVIFMRQTNKVL